MKVQISYTVDLKDIPQEVVELLGSVEAGEIYNLISEIVENVQKHNNIVKSLEQIDFLRQILMKVDTRLNDCYNILVGYQQALASDLLEGQQQALAVENKQDEEEKSFVAEQKKK